MTLRDLQFQEQALVKKIRISDKKILHRLALWGLMEGSKVELTEKSPFRGPVVYWVNQGFFALESQLASRIEVEPIKHQPTLR